MKKIYIAEDDIVTRTLVSEQVRSFGYEVIEFPDGLQAYDGIVASPDCDLLITDVKMPGMDGTDLIKKLRGMEAFVNLPIIIMSGVVGVKDITDLLKSGASRFLAKPIDPKDLEETIAQAISVPHVS